MSAARKQDKPAIVLHLSRSYQCLDAANLSLGSRLGLVQSLCILAHDCDASRGLVVVGYDLLRHSSLFASLRVSSQILGGCHSP